MDRSDLLYSLRSLPATDRVITALDFPTSKPALDLAARLGPGGGLVKVGLELFSAAGPQIVLSLQETGKSVFLDLKFHDIPNTVASAARVAAAMGAAMCTIHASCGRQALSAAAKALAEAPSGPGGMRPALLAVTVLTSLSSEQMDEVCPAADSLQDRVDRLARLAWDSGCDGLVCSAADLPRLRQAVGPEPLVVTPGIRLSGGDKQDQQRVTTPGEAVRAGADFLVVGRPITRSEDPVAALAAIANDMNTGVDNP